MRIPPATSCGTPFEGARNAPSAFLRRVARGRNLKVNEAKAREERGDRTGGFRR
ncbi:MAG: hypothetical protein ACYTG6_15730 [Planctomycetota bacterium]